MDDRINVSSKGHLKVIMSIDVDRKHPVALAVILVVTAAGIAGAIYMMDQAEARTKARLDDVAPVVVDVDVYTLARVDVPRLIEIRAFLEGIEEVTVVSEVAGVVAARTVEEGDAVQAGDVLIRVDETFHKLRADQAAADLARVEARLREAESAVQQAQAQVNSVKASRDNLANDFDKVSGLIENGDASRFEFDRADTALRQAEAELSAAQASLRRANDSLSVARAARDLATATLNEATTRLERCAVRSPIHGRVSRIMVEAGEYAAPAVPLVEVVRLDSLKLTVDLTGSQVRLIDAFDRATFVADADPQASYDCRLHHVSPKMDPTTRRFPVEFRIDNRHETLLAGMYGRVLIRCGAIENVLRLPRESVFKNYGAQSCLIVSSDDGALRAALRRIEIRDLPGSLDEIEVVSGLNEGDRVIVTRRRELTSGTPVKISRELAPSTLVDDVGL